MCGAVFARVAMKRGDPFPLFTFLLLERRDLPQTPWLIPLSCSVFLTQTRHLLEQLREDFDWNTFRANVGVSAC